MLFWIENGICYCRYVSTTDDCFQLPDNQVTFHIPLHRYLAAFLNIALKLNDLSICDVITDIDVLSQIMMHPLQIQVNHNAFLYLLYDAVSPITVNIFLQDNVFWNSLCPCILALLTPVLEYLYVCVCMMHFGVVDTGFGICLCPSMLAPVLIFFEPLYMLAPDVVDEFCADVIILMLSNVILLHFYASLVWWICEFLYSSSKGRLLMEHMLLLHRVISRAIFASY